MPPLEPTTRIRPVRIGFALEYVLGHITHSDNLKRTLEGDATVAPTYIDLPYHDDNNALPSVTRLPGIRSNWSLRASIGAYLGLRQGVKNKSFDSLFFHTQAASLFSTALMRDIPSVISLDATPIQYDTLGKHYGHTSGRNNSIEKLKKRLNVRALAAAQGIITWSEWAKDGLIKDYGVPAEKITVIPPGIDAEKWDFAAERGKREGIPGVTRPVHMLFVGGDFFRKGGDTLLDAVREMPKGANVHLDIVTKADDLGERPLPDRVSVHRGLMPNSAPLRKLYAEADLFVFPTRADCLPLAVMEALAAGLPVITTDIGALPEAVTHGENGWIVPMDDPAALTDALRRLTGDADLRNRLAESARETGRSRFDAATNYRRLAETIKATNSYRQSAVGSRAMRGAGRFFLPLPAFPRLPTADCRLPTAYLMNTLLLIPSVLKKDVEPLVEADRHPTMDYYALAEYLRRTADGGRVEMLDYTAVDSSEDARIQRARKFLGKDAALALMGFLRRGEFDAIFTNGENVSVPLAVMFRAARASDPGRRPGHVTIAHKLSTGKKRLFFRTLGLHREIDTLFVYAATQKAFGVERLGIPASKLRLIPFHADADFYRPLPDVQVVENRISAAGLEWRDYPTLIEAVKEMPDLEALLAAASPWSKHTNETEKRELPANVKARRYEYGELRDLYASSAFVVVPLYENDFQAGVTTLLEAMAMGKAVIVTETTGQRDVVTDGENGLTVPPGDVAAWKSALTRLRTDAVLRQKLGENARRWIEENATLTRWVKNIVDGIRDSAPARRENAERLPDIPDREIIV